MAILESFPGLEVTVEVDGQTATEYADPDTEDTDSRCVKFIEAKRGAKFVVRLKKLPTFRQTSQGLNWALSVDNEASSFNHSDGHSTGRLWTSKWSEFVTGNRRDGFMKHEFRFADLKTVCDKPQDEIKKDIKEAMNCGVIEARVFRTITLNYDSQQVLPTGLSIGSESLHEKSLKGQAKDSRISFDSSSCPETTLGSCMYLDRDAQGKMNPFATFQFKYRYKEGLMQEGIIPRHRGPSEETLPDMSEEGLLGGISEAETRRLALQMLRQQRNRRVKREAPADVPPSGLKYKQRRLADGRVEVDLTEEPVKAVKREVLADIHVASIPYKQNRLPNGKLEIDLTDD